VHHRTHTRGNFSSAERRTRVDVAPFQIEPHAQRTVFNVRQGSVLVADKAVKSAAAQAQQPESRDARSDFDGASTVHFQTSGKTFRPRGSERGTAGLQRGVRDFGSANLQTFHLRIKAEKLRRQKTAILFQIRTCIIQSLALDEILHRVGGDQSRVVALRVCRPEGVTIQQHLH
jgi:hypothetical protein